MVAHATFQVPMKTLGVNIALVGSRCELVFAPFTWQMPGLTISASLYLANISLLLQEQKLT